MGEWGLYIMAHTTRSADILRIVQSRNSTTVGKSWHVPARPIQALLLGQVTVGARSYCSLNSMALTMEWHLGTGIPKVLARSTNVLYCLN